MLAVDPLCGADFRLQLDLSHRARRRGGATRLYRQDRAFNFFLATCGVADRASLRFHRDGHSLALGLYFEPIRPLTARHAGVLQRIREGSVVVMVLSLVGIALLLLFKHYSESVLEWFAQWESTFMIKIRSRVVNFLRSFATGLGVIKNPYDFIASMACTVALWIVNVTAIWLDFHSLGGNLQHLSWWVAALTLVLAALGLAVQLPGVGGGYQVVTLLALRDFFRVSPEGATSAAILTWLTVMVPCLILGLILLLHEGLSFRKLQVITEEERDSVTPGA